MATGLGSWARGGAVVSAALASMCCILPLGFGVLGLSTTVVAAPLGAGIAAKETAKGQVGIEGRWRRARDRHIVAVFTDREHGRFGPINLRRATWYGHARGIIGEWAEQWVEIANSGRGEQIDDTRTWTLLPW